MKESDGRNPLRMALMAGCCSQYLSRKVLLKLRQSGQIAFKRACCSLRLIASPTIDV